MDASKRMPSARVISEQGRSRVRERYPAHALRGRAGPRWRDDPGDEDCPDADSGSSTSSSTTTTMMFANDVQQYAFHFTVDAKPKTRGVVAAPATPIIPDDDNAAFSQYMVHNNNVSPSSASSFSSGPLSSSSTSSYSELHSFHAYNTTPTPAPSESTPPPPQAISRVPAQPQLPQQQDSKRPSGACTRCKKMKMKCEFLPGAAACQRCSTRFPCVVEGRKPRTPSQREWLLAQLREKDSVIASLLSAYKPSGPTPLVLSTNKLLANLQPPPPLTSLTSPSTIPTPSPLDPAEKARFREALLAAEKGAPTSATKRWTAAAAAGDDDSDAASQSSSSDDDDSHDDAAWDGDAYVLPEPAAPMGLLASMSLDMQRERGGRKRGADALEGALEDTENEADECGIAGSEYFMPGPSTNLPLRRVLHTRDTPPMLISSRLLTWRDAEGLFQLFYQYVNPYVSVLDPVLHTCSSVYARCPFLFTVVCAISLRYSPIHAHTPSLYTLAMHFAKTAAATAFVDGVKSVEMVQAYFLLSLYGPAARRWEEDRSWFYGGLATRIAIDLGLHKLPSSSRSTTPKSELTARERRNRARTWLICFNIDRSSAAQFGKPRGVHSDDAVAEMVGAGRRWYKERWAHPYDLHLVMYVELLRVMGRFHERVAGGGGAGKCDLRAATEATEEELRVWHDDITWRYENESDPNDPGSVFRTKGVPLFENYMRLVMYSFGFQDAWKRHRVEPDNVFFAKCLQAASAGVRHIIDVIAPSGYLKYAPDCYFVMGGFSSAFLIKLLRPEFSSLIDTQQRTRIKTLVRALVDVLASPTVAIDEAHTPKLYARFLHGQLRAIDVQEGEEGGTLVEEREQVRARSEETETRTQTHTDAEATPPPPLFAHSTPGGASSPATSVPTPPAGYQWSDSGSGSATAAPGEGFEFDMGTGMELCEEDYLATMQAVSSEGWLNTMLMPGFSDKWGGGGEWGGVGFESMDVVGRE